MKHKKHSTWLLPAMGLAALSGAAQAQGQLTASTPSSGARYRASLDYWHDSLGAFDVAPGSAYEFGQVGAARLRLGGDWTLKPGTLLLHGELDLYAGRAYGDPTELGTPRVEQVYRDAVRFQTTPLTPRRLSVEWRTPVGVLEVGHVPSHWGLGIVAHGGQRDGRLFGDAYRGNLVERVSFATAPLAPLDPDPTSLARRVTVALAGDLIFADEQAQLLDEDSLGIKDTAVQGIFALFLRPAPVEARASGARPFHELSGGLYGVLRDQEYADGDTLTAFIVDGHLRYTQHWGADSHLRYEVEVAWINGETDRLITEQGPEGVDVSSSGAAFELEWATRSGPLPWSLTGLAGLASGDGDPDDDTLNRFSFHADYDAGLILFNHVIPALQRQAVAEVDDPLRTANPPEGLESLPGWGGVVGAGYGGLRLALGPWRGLEGGAQYTFTSTTAPLTDPYASFTAGGQPTNPFGGDAEGDLGHEVDLAVRYGFAMPGMPGLDASVRLTYGVFLPETVLKGPEGELGTVHLAQASLALQWGSDAREGGDR